jgi:hypothetical protein
LEGPHSADAILTADDIAVLYGRGVAIRDIDSKEVIAHDLAVDNCHVVCIDDQCAVYLQTADYGAIRGDNRLADRCEGDARPHASALGIGKTA